MNDIIDLDDYRGGPWINITTEKSVHVYPSVYFRDWIAGKSVEPIDEDVLKVIVRQWLESATELSGVTNGSRN